MFRKKLTTADHFLWFFFVPPQESGSEAGTCSGCHHALNSPTLAMFIVAGGLVQDNLKMYEHTDKIKSKIMFEPLLRVLQYKYYF